MSWKGGGMVYKKKRSLQTSEEEGFAFSFTSTWRDSLGASIPVEGEIDTSLGWVTSILKALWFILDVFWSSNTFLYPTSVKRKSRKRNERNERKEGKEAKREAKPCNTSFCGDICILQIFYYWCMPSSCV